MRNPRRVLIAIPIMLVVGFVVYLAIFISIGTGEYSDSPDGRFRAHANHTTFGLWWHVFEPEARLWIVRRDTKDEIWRLTYRPTSADALIDYGDRREKRITWAPDSRSVTIPITAGERITIPVAE